MLCFAVQTFGYIDAKRISSLACVQERRFQALQLQLPYLPSLPAPALTFSPNSDVTFAPVQAPMLLDKSTHLQYEYEDAECASIAGDCSQAVEQDVQLDCSYQDPSDLPATACYPNLDSILAVAQDRMLCDNSSLLESQQVPSADAECSLDADDCTLTEGQDAQPEASCLVPSDPECFYLATQQQDIDWDPDFLPDEIDFEALGAWLDEQTQDPLCNQENADGTYLLQ